jgi:energy-converting hydrogenase Eha subunit E
VRVNLLAKLASLLSRIFGPSEYHPFFSISAIFEVLAIGVSAFFLNAYQYTIENVNFVTNEIILVII